MSRHIANTVVLSLLLAITVACTNKKVSNPLANVGSKQPDKVLFDRAMEAMRHNQFDVSRITLQTLINTYPDSEFIARAKLAVADSWYAEGGSTALQQAEIEYKDFITFFPNMPEAAEAQLKVANIQYQEMEKPDRDFTHAMRAEEEYRSLIQQFPDSKLAGEAKQRLREVQEVLAQREFGIGRFYYLKQSYPAAIARLRTLVDRYPLYSQVDEALYLLGQSYEGEVSILRANGRMGEVAKARMIEEFSKDAAEAYSKIITRYPLMDRMDDARARLSAMHRTVPKPTRAAVAQNKKEIDSRSESGVISGVMHNFEKHPDVVRAAHVGEPTMVDTAPMNATEVVKQATVAAMGSDKGGTEKVGVETLGTGAPPPSDTVPHSDPETGAAVDPRPNGAGELKINTPAADPNELKPNVPADPNELKPNVAPAGAAAVPAPPQTNELQTPEAQAAAAAAGGPDETVDVSTSKKKKKGLKKIIPF